MRLIAGGIAASVSLVLRCASAHAGTIDTQISRAEASYQGEVDTPSLSRHEGYAPFAAGPHLLPEPGTLLLFGLGLIILGLIRRRPRD